MPHLVKMHEKHADKGLVVITVSLDPLNRKDRVKQANDFLRREKIPFRNLLLDESDEVIEKLGATFPPCYYVFDRRGKWVRFSATDNTDGVNYQEMDRVILQMLNER